MKNASVSHFCTNRPAICLHVHVHVHLHLQTARRTLLRSTAANAVAPEIPMKSMWPRTCPQTPSTEVCGRLGLNSYDDVVRIQDEIAARQKELDTNPPTARVQQLQNEIQERNNNLTTYEAKIKPFLTQGWFRDLTTDLNGTALHRLQVFCWTWLLCGIFVFTVWRTLGMPEYSGTSLALMSISSAGYVGFKIPEKNT